MPRVECVLICGFGAFGEQHARAWRLLDPAIALMVADPSEAALARARQFGIAADRLAADPAALIMRADIVDVVAPPAFHLPLALTAIEGGKPVMIEKPAVRSIAEAVTLIDAVGHLPVQIGMVLRAHPLTAEAARMLAEDAIGELLAIEGDFSGWKRMRADSSLAENDGVHFLDLMRLFAGAPVIDVDARSWSLLDPLIRDDVVIELGFANGVKGKLRLGVLAAGDTEDAFVPGALTTKRLTLIGRAGNIVLDFNRNRLIHSTVSYNRSAAGHDAKPLAIVSQTTLGMAPEALLAKSFTLFSDAVRTGAPVMCDAPQGALELAATLAAIDASLARQSSDALRIDGARS